MFFEDHIPAILLDHEENDDAPPPPAPEPTPAIDPVPPVKRKQKTWAEKLVFDLGYYCHDIFALSASCVAQDRVLSTEERTVPNTLRQAAASPESSQWEAARLDEINSLHKNDTLEIMERPAGCRVLGLKWVFKIKEHIDGTIARYKVRCTALGNL